MHTQLLMLGQLLDDRYQVIQTLEASRYSQVYIAKDVTQTGTPQCKISCFRPVSTDYRSLEAAREIFRSEAQKLYQLSSYCDRIPQVLSAFEFNKDFYLVEEAIEGRSLGEELAVGMLLSEDQAIAMLADVLATLHVAHEEQLIHGDVIPANLIGCTREHSTDRPEIVLVNFAGMRKICNPLLSSQDVPLLGTPSYMPAEQSQGDRAPNCDLYALGLTTIQALTGLHPSQIDFDPETAAIAWPPDLNIDRNLAEILERMVCHNPEERYQSAAEVLADLQGLQASGVKQIALSFLERARQIPLVTIVSLLATLVASVAFFNLGKYVSRLSSEQSAQNLVTVVGASPKPIAARKPTPAKDRKKAIQPAERSSATTKGRDPKLEPFVSKPKPITTPAAEVQITAGAIDRAVVAPTRSLSSSQPSSRSPLISTQTPTQLSTQPTTSKPAVSLPALKPRYTLLGHEGSVQAVSFFANGHSFASGSADKTVRLWDTSARRALIEMSDRSGYKSSVTSIATSPDGHTFASGALDRSIQIWDFRSGKSKRLLLGHTDRVLAVGFDPSGQYLVSGSGDRTVKLWDLSIGKEILTLSAHTDTVTSVAVSPDGKLIASGSEDMTIVLWDMATGKKIRTLRGHKDAVQAIAFSPDGKSLASGSTDKTVKLWDISTGKQVLTLNGHTQKVTSLAFRSDGNVLASGSFDKNIRLWDVQTGASQTLSWHSEPVLSVAFSAKDRTLISGGADKTIIVWR
jgi:serine/threonine protein kinase